MRESLRSGRILRRFHATFVIDERRWNGNAEAGKKLVKGYVGSCRPSESNRHTRFPSTTVARGIRLPPAESSYCLPTSNMTIQNHKVRIVEVGPRDGLQNIRDKVPTPTKLELIRRLRDAGLRTIELTSVVSPRAIPQLADCREVLGHSSVKALLQDGHASLRLPVLVPNVKGLDIAVQHGVKEVAVFISATEGFSRANINCSVEQGIARAREVSGLARKSNVAVRG